MDVDLHVYTLAVLTVAASSCCMVHNVLYRMNARIFFLPCGVLNPVPNICSLRLPDDAFLTQSYVSSEMMVNSQDEIYTVLGDLSGYAGNYYWTSRHEVTTADIDWTSYDAVRRYFMALYEGTNYNSFKEEVQNNNEDKNSHSVGHEEDNSKKRGIVLAIHWWQRSWQKEN